MYNVVVSNYAEMTRKRERTIASSPDWSRNAMALQVIALKSKRTSFVIIENERRCILAEETQQRDTESYYQWPVHLLGCKRYL
jgi:hypothetical protein